MQRRTRNEVGLEATFLTFDSIGRYSAINGTASNYEKSREKLKNQATEFTGTYDADIARYIPGTLDFAYQGVIEDIDTKEKTAHISYKDMK